jgi:molecular chaperone DnaJ
VKMRVPEGTQPGRVFRIRGRGIPQASGKNAPRGDHLFTSRSRFRPSSRPQKQLIEELAASERGGGLLPSGDPRRRA